MVEVDPLVVVLTATATVCLLILTYFIQSFLKKKSHHGHGQRHRKRKDEKEPAPRNKKVAQKKVDEIAVNSTIPSTDAVLHANIEEAASNVNFEVLDHLDTISTRKKAKETPQQKAARLERQKKAKVSKPTAVGSANETAIPDAANETNTSASVSATRSISTDGWAIVEVKKKSKPKKSATAKAAPEAQTADIQKSQLTVDGKKIGIIIGPKGSTLKSIQDITGVEIVTPKTEKQSSGPSVLSINGSPEGVAAASKIIRDLCEKGFSSALGGPDFIESSISVHPL